MAKVTWLGEDQKDVPGPSFNMWNGIKFPKGKAVEVTSEEMLSQARGNQFYKVVEAAKAEPKPVEAPSAKTPEAKVEVKVEAKKEEKAPGRKDPHDYPPAKKAAPKKQVRKPAAHAHR